MKAIIIIMVKVQQKIYNFPMSHLPSLDACVDLSVLRYHLTTTSTNTTVPQTATHTTNAATTRGYTENSESNAVVNTYQLIW